MNPDAVYGIYETAAGEYLTRLAKLVPAGQAIVEIGVFQGRSLAFLAMGAHDAEEGVQVYGVDPWNLPRESKPKYNSDETYQAVRKVFSLTPHVHLVRDFSVEAAAKWRGPKIGLLHIDADHTDAGVRSDFRAWMRHLAPGAAVCFDDYHRSFPGVITAVDDFWQEGVLSVPVRPEGATRLAVTEFLG
jgi:predicted O-methyltransferase YrrM